jgi:hypothetical protein
MSANRYLELLEAHTKEEEKRFEAICSDIRSIRDNHLSHVEFDIQSLKTQGAGITADIAWVKWGIMAVFGTLVATFLANMFR